MAGANPEFISRDSCLYDDQGVGGLFLQNYIVIWFLTQEY